MTSTANSFMTFLTSRRINLRNIAGRSRGDYTVDDVYSEAWLIADEIRRKRGFAVNFSNHDDQELVLAWLHCKLIRFAEKHIRFAVKLDKGWDSEDSEFAVNRLAWFLAAPEQFDPAIRIELDQEHVAPLELVKHSYSQASAYVILLDRFDWELERLANHLRLVASTVRSKMTATGQHMKRQPSLFDRIQTIDNNFIPTIARGLTRIAIGEEGPQQLAWEFA